MQLLTSDVIKFFDSTFRKKFNFEDYVSKDKPTLFFGVYSNGDARRIINHRGIKLVLLNGIDSRRTEVIQSIYNSDNKTVFIAGSKWVEEDLKKAGMPYERISFFLDDIYNWRPEPLGNSLYWYKAHTTEYGKKYLRAVRKEFPYLNIITNDSKTVPREKIRDIYKQCFASLRPVEQDGMSQGVAEMGLMGRMSIWNGGGAFSVPFLGVEDILEAIRTLRKGYNYKLISRRTRQFFIRSEIQWTNLVLKTCGTSELDTTGIFNESHSRCGSIFRIMRRSVIDKMPEQLGRDQFERPYINCQLYKMGLKQLITSKNSGFIASEWKGRLNKGYPNDLKEFYTYDKKYSIGNSSNL